MQKIPEDKTDKVTYRHEFTNSVLDDIAVVDPLGTKSSDESFVWLINPQIPSLCSISKAEGLSVIVGIQFPLTRILISVPIGSVTFNENRTY